jgi:hypothetical protein
MNAAQLNFEVELRGVVGTVCDPGASERHERLGHG